MLPSEEAYSVLTSLPALQYAFSPFRIEFSPSQGGNLTELKAELRMSEYHVLKDCTSVVTAHLEVTAANTDGLRIYKYQDEIMLSWKER